MTLYVTLQFLSVVIDFLEAVKNASIIVIHFKKWHFIVLMLCNCMLLLIEPKDKVKVLL